MLPRMVGSIENEIDRAAHLGQRLEDLVLEKVKVGGFITRTERDDLVIGYWSMIFDYDKGIVCLLQNKFYSPAFALLRPTMEALVRAHVVLIGSEQDVLKIRQDRYSVNYEKVGAQIDKAFGMSPVIENYLKTARSYLHSLTHSGKAQLLGRFRGTVVGAGFSDAEIEGLVRNSASAVFLVTFLIAKHFGFDEERLAAGRIWVEYSGPA
jgi:hypothetical protein